MRHFIICFSLLFFTLSAAAGDFVLGSNSFKDKSALAAVYTCDGLDVSPELHWSHIPEKTQALALVLADPDAPTGTFYHWLVYNIPTNTSSFAEAVKNMPSGTLVGKNSWNSAQYKGPCPPKGSAHHYLFTLYALDAKVNVPAEADATTLLDSFKNHIIKQIQLSAEYGR